MLEISAIVAAAGVLVGVVFTVMELRNLVKQRQIDLVNRIYSSLSTREYLEAWEEFRSREITDLNEYGKEHGLQNLT
jgi:hypothetical protein